MAVYACADLHGNYNIWTKIKSFLKEDDTLFFLGDAADRGPDGWDILVEAMEDSRVKYILGNHDVMLLDRVMRNDYPNVALHVRNGGEPTWASMTADVDEVVVDTLSKLNNCPYYMLYFRNDGKIVFMSHSGSINLEDNFSLIWSRAFNVDISNRYDYVIHGHTGIKYLIEDARDYCNFYEIDSIAEAWDGNSAYFYGRDRNRIDIDITTIQSGKAILLNLDTMESIIMEGGI